MSIPAFATLVDEPTATVPLAGPITNVVRAIGTNGIIGVKSGYTGQAGGCMVLAADRTVAGHSVLVWPRRSASGNRRPLPHRPGAAPGAPAATSTTPATTAPPTTTTTTAPAKPYSAVEAEYPLLYAGPIVEGLLYVTETEVTPVTLTRPGGVVGTATVDWAGSRRSVPVVAAAGATLVACPASRSSGW